MKTALAAIFAMSLLGLPQQANAETLMGMLCSKARPTASATGGKHLDQAPTGSVVKSKNPAHADAAKKPAYPEALLWSLPYP